MQDSIQLLRHFAMRPLDEQEKKYSFWDPKYLKNLYQYEEIILDCQGMPLLLIMLAFVARLMPLQCIEIKNKQSSLIRNNRFIQIKSLEMGEGSSRVINQDACPKIQTMMRLGNQADVQFGLQNRNIIRLPNRVFNMNDGLPSVVEQISFEENEEGQPLSSMDSFYTITDQRNSKIKSTVCQTQSNCRFKKSCSRGEKCCEYNIKVIIQDQLEIDIFRFQTQVLVHALMTLDYLWLMTHDPAMLEAFDKSESLLEINLNIVELSLLKSRQSLKVMKINNKIYDCNYRQLHEENRPQSDKRGVHWGQYDEEDQQSQELIPPESIIIYRPLPENSDDLHEDDNTFSSSSCFDDDDSC